MVKRGADVGSDHHLLLAKVKLHLKKAIKLKDGTKLKFNITKLKDPSISKMFTTLLKNRFQVLVDIGEGIEEHPCENIWESIKNVYTDVSNTVLGVKMKQDKNWIDDKTWTLIDNRRHLKEKMMNAKSDRLLEKYSKECSEANKETKRKLRQDRRSYLDRRANEAETAVQRGELSEVYRITRELTGSYSKCSGPVKDKNGNKITSENLKLERWAENFNQVLNRPEPTKTAIVDENFGEQLRIELEPPTKEEIKKAINKLRNNKAPGIDSLESELFKADPKIATDQLHVLFTKKMGVRCAFKALFWSYFC